VALTRHLCAATFSTVLCALFACGGRGDLPTEAAAAAGDPAEKDEATPQSGAECREPQPVFQEGTTIESGFVRCSDGFVHRVAPATCAAPATAGACDIGHGDCATDADCGERPYGACVVAEPWVGCGCVYGCETDADCDAGQICACAGVAGDRSRCVSASCSTSAECSDGLCGLSTGVGSCNQPYGRLACHGPGAPCRVDADCASEDTIWCHGEYEPAQCRLYGDDWTCGEPWGCGPCG
jgi:hypothetical protein